MPCSILKLAFSLLMLLISICCSQAFADNSKLSVSVVAEEFPPYQYKESGKPKGIAVEIVKQVLADSDLTADIKFYPWTRALRLAESAPNTIILSITRSAKREDDFYWLGLISRHELYLWVNKKRWGNTNFTDAMLSKLTIGVPRNGHQHQFLKSHPLFFNNVYSVVNTKEQSLNMLAVGRIDAISGDPKLLRRRMINVGLSPNLLKPVKHFPNHQTELYIAMSKNSNVELVNKLTAQYARFVKTKQFQRIVNNTKN